MSESLSLRELSDAAPQGDWTLEEMPNDAGSRSNAFTSFGIEADGKTLLDTLNATGMYLEQEPDGDGGYAVWDAQGKAVIEYVLALVRGHRAGRLHTSEDLDAAHAKGRAEGIGEAVAAAQAMQERCAAYHDDLAAQHETSAAAIRALATQTAGGEPWRIG